MGLLESVSTAGTHFSARAHGGGRPLGDPYLPSKWRIRILLERGRWINIMGAAPFSLGRAALCMCVCVSGSKMKPPPNRMGSGSGFRSRWVEEKHGLASGVPSFEDPRSLAV